MADSLLRKVNSRIKFLARNTKYLDQSSMKLLANALVLSHMDYACTSWYSGLTKKTKSRLQVSQNKLVRLVLKLPNRTHLNSEHFKQVNWLPINDRVNQIKVVHVHEVLQREAPSYLCNHFHYSARQGHHTHSSHFSLFIPRVNLLVGKSTFMFSGAVEWNKLPSNIQRVTSRNNFKDKVKSHYLNLIVNRENDVYV